MRQHCGRHAEPNHYSPQPGGHAIHPRWSIPRCHAHRAEGYDPAVVEGDHGIEKEVCVAAGWVLIEMHVTDWATARVSHWNKSSEFTLLTFTTFVPRPKKVKKFFSKFSDAVLTPLGH